MRIRRTPAGTPSGGRFAAGAHAAPDLEQVDVTLASAEMDQINAELHHARREMRTATARRTTMRPTDPRFAKVNEQFEESLARYEAAESRRSMLVDSNAE